MRTEGAVMPGFGLRGVSCACCTPPALGRRGLFGLGLAAAGAGLLRPARAASGDYEAMLLSCIDPRMVEPVHDWMAAQGLRGQYSQFVIAGAAIGVEAPPFRAWQRAFWDNLAASEHLHKIDKLVVVDHRDCGAAVIAYGRERVATAQAETALHTEVAAKFRGEMRHRFPALAVETWLMALDGSVVRLG